MRGLEEQVQQVRVGCMSPHVLSQHKIQQTLQKNAIVNRNEPHSLRSIPAGLTSACDGLVHYIICHQEVCLHTGDTVWNHEPGPAPHPTKAKRTKSTGIGNTAWFCGIGVVLSRGLFACEQGQHLQELDGPSHKVCLLLKLLTGTWHDQQ